MLASGVFQRLWHWGRSEGRTPRTPHINFTYMQPYKPITQWHVALMGWATCPNFIGCKWHVSTPHWETTIQYKYATSSNCHIIMMVRPSTWPYGLYGQVQLASQIFPCLTWRSNRDISSIRTPFAKVNIPPESGKWDRRNGTIFIAFWELWKLSKFWSPDHIYINIIK